MSASSRVYVAGHTGLVGSALVRALSRHGALEVVTRTRSELDLTDQPSVRAFFSRERPEIVCLAAAKVGGILANDTFPAEFIRENLAIQDNVIHEAWKSGVQRLLFLGSSCIYPRDCPQPIREDYLMTGPLEATNRPYAMAKLAGLEMCWAYNRQYGTRYICAMPTNLYGPGDHYDLKTSHVLPALIRKFHEAKLRRDASVTLWGSGEPRRDLLYSHDMAEACMRLLFLDEREAARLFPADRAPIVNIGSGEDRTIRELAELVREVVGSDAEIVWDRSRPDGTPRKILDVGRIRSTGWEPKVGLREGIGLALAEFASRKVSA